MERSGPRGFTLIQWLVIIGILVAIVVPAPVMLSLAADVPNPSDAELTIERKPSPSSANAPLKPTHLTVTRSGKILTLHCSVLDAAGRGGNRGAAPLDPPRFAVYQRGREIGSGSFEYG